MSKTTSHLFIYSISSLSNRSKNCEIGMSDIHHQSASGTFNHECILMPASQIKIGFSQSSVDSSQAKVLCLRWDREHGLKEFILILLPRAQWGGRGRLVHSSTTDSASDDLWKIFNKIIWRLILRLWIIIKKSKHVRSRVCYFQELIEREEDIRWRN